MSKASKISDAEWQVMQVIWHRSPISASEIVQELEPHTGWNHRTIRTMLNRLVQKEVLDYDVEGNRYLYRPNVTRARCVRKESESFLNKVFSGDANSLLVHFVRSGKISADDLQELQRILEDGK